MGLVPLTNFTYFPNTNDLKNELTFYNKIDDNTFNKIMKIITQHNHEFRKKIKYTIESYNFTDNIEIKIIDLDKKQKFIITCKDFPNEFILGKKHYYRLRKMYNGDINDVDFWICLLLLK